jgi:hypothetical protein
MVKDGHILQATGIMMEKHHAIVAEEVADVLPAQGKVDIMKYSIDNLYVNMTVFNEVEKIEINVDLI